MLNSTSKNNGISLISDQDYKILSVGVSTGGNAETRIANKFPDCHITAMTLDFEGSNCVCSQIEKERLSDRIEVKIENVSKSFPYENEFFDFVYARLVLHYLVKKDLKNSLQELYRMVGCLL